MCIRDPVARASTACRTANGKGLLKGRSAMTLKRAGFTLIEMLVVLSLVALLLSVALPRYFSSLERARDVALEENLKVLRLTLDRYHADKGRYPPNLQALVDQRYLASVPVDPVTGSADSWVLISAPVEEGATDETGSGISNVRSGAAGQAHDGRAYETL